MTRRQLDTLPLLYAYIGRRAGKGDHEYVLTCGPVTWIAR